jgi:hypothetical protein
VHIWLLKRGGLPERKKRTVLIANEVWLLLSINIDFHIKRFKIKFMSERIKGTLKLKISEGEGVPREQRRVRLVEPGFPRDNFLNPLSQIFITGNYGQNTSTLEARIEHERRRLKAEARGIARVAESGVRDGNRVRVAVRRFGILNKITGVFKFKNDIFFCVGEASFRYRNLAWINVWGGDED